MAIRILMLAALVVSAYAAIIPAPAPLAVAPYASSYAAHVTHHSVAAPIVAAPAATLLAAPTAPLLAASPARLVAAPITAAIATAPVVPQFVSPASLLLK